MVLAHALEDEAPAPASNTVYVGARHRTATVEDESRGGVPAAQQAQADQDRDQHRLVAGQPCQDQTPLRKITRKGSLPSAADRFRCGGRTRVSPAHYVVETPTGKMFGRVLLPVHAPISLRPVPVHRPHNLHHQNTQSAPPHLLGQSTHSNTLSTSVSQACASAPAHTLGKSYPPI
eukprot:3356532-Rhodomonas_salina.1